MNYLISIGTLKLSYLTQSTKQSIQSYINNNRYVITHTDKVSVKGYKGAGYIAIDPTTGEGAYMISGGMNGSFLSPEDGLAALIFVSSIALTLGTTMVLTALVLTIASIIILTYHNYLLLGIYGCSGMQTLFLTFTALVAALGLKKPSIAQVIMLNGYFSWLYPLTINTSAENCK